MHRLRPRPYPAEQDSRPSASFANTFPSVITQVTVVSGFFCYTVVNAFATVCSLSGDPDGSSITSAFPARRLVPALISMRAACEVSNTVFENLLSPSRKKTIE